MCVVCAHTCVCVMCCGEAGILLHVCVCQRIASGSQFSFHMGPWDQTQDVMLVLALQH